MLKENISALKKVIEENKPLEIICKFEDGQRMDMFREYKSFEEIIDDIPEIAEEKYKINTDKKIHDCKIANINLFCIYPHHIEKNNAKIFIENLNKLQYKCIV